ncbi:MAG: IMP dehydrogenase [Treponema sp.]|jgi:IMP dehydrogenase|nr:IMP dehydrogenase [Treponema sp.]MBQ1644075.1 IMP dehydrogenase [Treponema sp.]MBQ2207109.1 IMP dehydrogenase [Treponema sp.]MBQ2463957.1 IMP dehydrogenase [Treponema sp.]MBQ2571660.1 IMP dehydrogenase [Treponema sp.]
MAFFYDEPSHTFGEYLLIPGYTSADCIPEHVSLRTPVTRFNKKAGEESDLYMNIPMVSAVMQSVSDDKMAIALAQEGGISFIYGSQSIEDQAAMVARVKAYKAGFVTSDSNIRPDQTLADVIALIKKTGHSTIAVTADGSAHGKLEGIITERDFRIDHVDASSPVSKYMTPFKDLVTGEDGISLKDANDLIWKHKVNQLPVIDKNGNLVSLVFRKDFDSAAVHPLELHDSKHRYIVGAGINTRDYMDRVPKLLEAGVDVLCLDSSEGYSEWQARALHDIHEKFGANVKVGAGNVVDREGFMFLAENGADFVKIGIGGGSICITREQKGIGRGQATATIEVAKARDEYYAKTGIYVPICSDGGIVHDYHITLALAMGADFVMLGRYFARFDESPTNKLVVNGNYVKEYWGEGSNRARNWQRYDLGGKKTMAFEEGVDSYVPYAGHLHDGVALTISKVVHTMCNCGALSIPELQQKAKLTLVSAVTVQESGAHDVTVKAPSIHAE